jgi:hypothetical protein
MTALETAPLTTPASRVPTGPAAAAVLAAGIGCLALGLFTTLCEISGAVKTALNWWDPVGPLSGKTGLAYAVWLASWVVLHQLFKHRQTDFGKLYVWSLVLIFLGLVGTFPTFFALFGH